MKLMKNVFILTLMVASFLLMACTNSSGGDTPSSDDDNPSWLDDLGGTISMPASWEDDPFGNEGGIFYLEGNNSLRYVINTPEEEDRTITVEKKLLDKWVVTNEYAYSYNSTVTPPTITVRIEKVNLNGTMVTLFDEIDNTSNPNRRKEAIKILNVLSTYEVILNLDANPKTVEFTPQYTPDYDWYYQAGECAGGEGSGNEVKIKWPDRSILVNGESYEVVNVSSTTIECKTLDESSTEKRFRYIKEGTNTSPIIKVILDSGAIVTCTWTPVALD